MAFRTITLLAIAGLSSLSVACGSTKDDPGSTGSKLACDPNDKTIPCYKGKAEPCDTSPNSNFNGDQYCMKPPDPGSGYQLHVGPKDYTDPVEIQKWVLPPGGGADGQPDVNFCYFMKTPNDHEVYTNQYYSHMRPGSHHYIMFGLAAGTDKPDSEAPVDCGERNGEIAGGANFISGATRLVQNAAMFGDAPEDQGLGSPIPAHQQLNMNLHFVNVGSKPVLEELWVNMIEKPQDEVTDVVRGMEWLGGLAMNITPGTHTVLKSPVTGGNCVPPMADTRLLGVTAHMHASTTRVSMYYQGQSDADRKVVFDDFNWEEPTVWRFNSTLTNPAPDRSTGTSGAGINGVFTAQPGDQFSWECDVNNTTTTTLTFSDKAYTGEMCNVFGMYSNPKAADPWLCYFL